MRLRSITGVMYPDHRIRSIRPEDRHALVRFHARLSAETRYRRYHGSKGELTRSDLEYLTVIDGVNHVAAVVVDEAGEIDAVARVIAAGDYAELAVVVADDRQGQGLGIKATLAALEAFVAAGHDGPVSALVQPDNRVAMRLFMRLGGKRGDWLPGDPVEIVLDPRRCTSPCDPSRGASSVSMCSARSRTRASVAA